MLKAYRQHVSERAAQNIVPKALDAIQTMLLIELLKKPPIGEEKFLIELLTNRIPAGVDEAAYIKAEFLTLIAKGKIYSPLVTRKKSIKLLGTMRGGYNISSLIDLLNDKELSSFASIELSHIILIFDSFNEVVKKSQSGNIYAEKILQSWAKAEWFLRQPKLLEKITLTVFKVSGETNTDDLSPAQDAWSRPDIPLHALSMLKYPRKGIKPDVPGKIGPIKQIQYLKSKGFPLVYVGDIVGTGSSRKSAVNSILWFMGSDIPYVPNKKIGGFCLGEKIAPIFFNTLEDSGALPIEVDVSKLNMGDIIDIYPYEGIIRDHSNNEILANFNFKNNIIMDEVRAGGRISLIIGRNLTEKACSYLGTSQNNIFLIRKNIIPKRAQGFSLAQKIVGRACGVEGIAPGIYCEPKVTSVGSQDTTGPMTRDELKDLACLKFSADLVMQSFCHTAAYPQPIDIKMHQELSNFIIERGGIALRPGDGIIHSWLNRMLLPDTIGTGGDSHTRFPIGISFPGGSGIVAFAATTGMMPLNMPESVLVRFKGKIQPGITLRDLVHSIPLYAIKNGLLTIQKEGKKNIFSGRILEIEGLPKLKVEQAFEFTDSSAERSAAACTIKLDKEPVIEYINSNIILLKWLISEGYKDRGTLEYRIQNMEKWLNKPQLLESDMNAQYATVIEINLKEITEPILCVPNDPDDVHLLSEVQGHKIDEVFIGSCMTNIGHFRMAGKLLDTYKRKLQTQLWIAPPTKMDLMKLTEEGYYEIFINSGARLETPGCSLCMGNQARVKDGATVISTSTRNFPNRLGKGANVYLASAELAAISSLLGRIPTVFEYMEFMSKVIKENPEIYNYLNFNKLNKYVEDANRIILKVKL